MHRTFPATSITPRGEHYIVPNSNIRRTYWHNVLDSVLLSVLFYFSQCVKLVPASVFLGGVKEGGKREKNSHKK